MNFLACGLVVPLKLRYVICCKRKQLVVRSGLLVRNCRAWGWCLYGDRNRPQEDFDSEDWIGVLPRLLQEGWVPARETLVGAVENYQAYCVVLSGKEG